jgi:hypothetical protein
MKTLNLNALLIAACTLVLIACDKKEQESQQLETSVVKTEVKDYVPPTVENLYGKYFKAIDTICPAYLKLTTKIDITGLQDNVSYGQITDGILVLTQPKDGEYQGSFDKHNPTTTGWWKSWDISPYVEMNNPHNLGLSGNTLYEGMQILLSKKCYVFGIEVGSLLHRVEKRPIRFSVAYYNKDVIPNGDPIGFVHQVITWPSGARLFAIKSDVPFDRIRIGYNYSSADPVRAVSIANIRYITDKKIYDKHKNKL